jgi:hypothetical protein
MAAETAIIMVDPQADAQSGGDSSPLQCLLCAELEKRGVPRNSELGQFVAKWVEEKLRTDNGELSEGWEARLPDLIERGIRLARLEELLHVELDARSIGWEEPRGISVARWVRMFFAALEAPCTKDWESRVAHAVGVALEIEGRLRAEFDARGIAWVSAQAEAISDWLIVLFAEHEDELGEEWREILASIVDLTLGLYESGVRWQDEPDRLLSFWLVLQVLDDANPSPADWSTRLDDAVALGRDIWTDFDRQFREFFEAEYSIGKLRVRQRVSVALSRRTETDRECVVEAIIERIWKKKRHLLCSLYSRYQRTLFEPRQIDSAGLPGYFMCVADTESRNRDILPPPAGPILTDIGPGHDDEDDGGCSSDAAQSDGGNAEDDGRVADRRWVPDALDKFYCAENGFKERHRLEGMVSAGLGAFLRDPYKPDIVERAREIVRLNLPAHEDKRKRLIEESSRLLSKLDAAREKRSFAASLAEVEADNEDIWRLEERLIRLQDDLRQLPDRFRPTLGEAKIILGPHVVNVGNTRNERLRLERELLENRIGRGWRRVLGAYEEDSRASAKGALLGGATKAAIVCVRNIATELQRQIAEHIVRGCGLKSPRKNGLTDEERHRRQNEEDRWLADGSGLLDKTRETTRVVDQEAVSFPERLRTDLLRWLADAEDYCELGVPRRQGILRGLTCRSQWRLRHLLRVTKPAVDGASGGNLRSGDES